LGAAEVVGEEVVGARPSAAVEEELKAGADGVDCGGGELADSFGQFGFVDAVDLGYVDDARFGEIGGAFFQPDVSGARARERFEVIRQTTVVEIRLRLKMSL
jgi:hypothetical protein